MELYRYFQSCRKEMCITIFIIAGAMHVKPTLDVLTKNTRNWWPKSWHLSYIFWLWRLNLLGGLPNIVGYHCDEPPITSSDIHKPSSMRNPSQKLKSPWPTGPPRFTALRVHLHCSGDAKSAHNPGKRRCSRICWRNPALVRGVAVKRQLVAYMLESCRKSAGLVDSTAWIADWQFGSQMAGWELGKQQLVLPIMERRDIRM